MRRRLATIYAMLCTLLLAVGFLSVFYFAFKEGTTATVNALLGFILGFILAPCLHELGHVSLGALAKMDCVYVKCFCFKIYVKNGKKRFGFASPFYADETQVIPRKSGNMLKRASVYTLGGLLYSGIFLVLIVVGVILSVSFGQPSYILLGLLPYAGYLFLLNVAPFEYASGKTDMLVFVGLKTNQPAEKTMLSAMEIQGCLYEGKSFTEIDESLYFNVPQLCEDEPLFAVMQDLRYRYYIEKGDLDKAGDSLNRLAQAQAYLSDIELQKTAAELTYMHALLGDFEGAEESGKLCREYLALEYAAAKRVLAAYSSAFGKTDAVAPLKTQAEELLVKERILGLKKFEKILLERIKAE